jgi:phthiodiolone/phenolphthiodiolone dimycocerosates ketoreductase
MLELSAMGPPRPPVDAVLAAARRREEQGFDAVWWADHLLHWFPDSIWTPDLIPQAGGQASPHVWMDPFAVIAAAGGATSRVRLGVAVTDVVRRHPAQLAMSALTLDHLTGGRFMLGLGTGEALNLAPIGLRNDRPLGRLAEAIEVIRTLWASPDPVTFEGEHFTLRGMSLGLRPLGDAPPPIWVAAHRPRGLELTGRTADGWLPLVTDPGEYARMLGEVRAAERAAAREGAVTAGLYARVVLAERFEDAVTALDQSFAMRFIALTRPDESFRVHGAEHPLGAGAFGLTDLLPTDLDRDTALALARAVPAEVVRETVIHGTPDQVADGLAAMVAAGAEHVQLTNMTPLAAPALAPASEALMGEAVAELRRRTG